MPKLIKMRTIHQPVTLRQFHERKDNILIYRQNGGLGDILMHRMIFEDFKKINPDVKVSFACPVMLLDAVRDHPFIDNLYGVENINLDNFVYYNTSHACCRYETGISPLSDKHRSDIWAEHCGVKLTNHNMHLNLTNDEIEYGKACIDTFKQNKPTVAFCPISAMASKNLTPQQMEETINGLRNFGLFPFSIHKGPIEKLSELKVPVFINKSIRQWMGIINAADYVVTVDTAAFHLAGGLNKPLTGIFTWADGKVYGKYFDFVLVQKHRDNGDWHCGPCYSWTHCPLSRASLKPCLTELTGDLILKGVEKMLIKWIKPHR